MNYHSIARQLHMWRRAARRIARRVFKIVVLSTGLFAMVGLWRYFDSVWQHAPRTANPFDITWIASIAIALTTGTIILGMFSFFTPGTFRVISRFLGGLEDATEERMPEKGQPRTGSKDSERKAFIEEKFRILFWIITLGVIFSAGYVTQLVWGFRASLDPLWASVLVAIVLAAATMLQMFESRLFRMEAVQPVFGFAFTIWPMGGIPHMWYLKNSGGLARSLRIDIKQGDDSSKMFVPTCGRDELAQLGQDFNERYERGGRLNLAMNFQDVYRRRGKQDLEIDFDELKSSGRTMPYSHHPSAALDEIVLELRRIQP